MPETKLNGKVQELKGYVFDCLYLNRATKYIIIRDEIEEYTRRTFPQGGDIMQVIKKEQRLTYKVLDDLTNKEKESVIQVKIQDKQIEAIVKHQAQLEENMQHFFPIIVGQYTNFTRAKLEGSLGWKQLEEDLDLIKLLKLLKEIISKFLGAQVWGSCPVFLPPQVLHLQAGRDHHQ